MAHKQRMYELKTQRLQAVMENLKYLKEMGVTLNARIAGRLIVALQDEDGSGADMLLSPKGPSCGTSFGSNCQG